MITEIERILLTVYSLPAVIIENNGNAYSVSSDLTDSELVEKVQNSEDISTDVTITEI